MYAGPITLAAAGAVEQTPFAREVWLSPNQAVWIMGATTRCRSHDVDQPGVMVQESCAGIGVSLRVLRQRRRPTRSRSGPPSWGRSELSQKLIILRPADGQKVLDPDVLLSTDYSSLRPGYWVTFVGHFPDSADAEATVSQLHALGYEDAYVREVGA